MARILVVLKKNNWMIFKVISLVSNYFICGTGRAFACLMLCRSMTIDRRRPAPLDGSLAVQEAAMYRRLLLIVVLGSLMAACVPYGDHGYYRNDVYTVDRYSYRDYDRPSYSYGRGYYVVPQQRYYAPAPRYYRAAPEAYYNNRYQGRGYDARYRHDEHGYRDAPRRDRDGWRGNDRGQWHDGGRDAGRGRDHGRGQDYGRGQDHGRGQDRDGRSDRNWNR